MTYLVPAIGQYFSVTYPPFVVFLPRTNRLSFLFCHKLTFCRGFLPRTNRLSFWFCHKSTVSRFFHYQPFFRLLVTHQPFAVLFCLMPNLFWSLFDFFVTHKPVVVFFFTSYQPFVFLFLVTYQLFVFSFFFVFLPFFVFCHSTNQSVCRFALIR